MSTIATVVMALVGILMVHNTCKPYNALRKLLMGFICAMFLFCALFLHELFTLTGLDFSGVLVVAVFAGLAWPVLKVCTLGLDHLSQWSRKHVRMPSRRHKTASRRGR